MKVLFKKNKRINWTFKMLKNESKKYKTRGEFQKNNRKAYQTARNHGYLDKICKHMKNPKNWEYDLEQLKTIAKKYKTRGEFSKNKNGAYQVAIKMGIIDKICKHMGVSLREPWTIKELEKEALKYDTKVNFRNKNNAAYNASRRMGILNKICIHMKRCGNSSEAEIKLTEIIKEKYPSVKKLRRSKVNMPNKSHIHWFDLDIFIPELKAGIEYNGRWYHSNKGLKRSRKHWPDEDIENYHALKNMHFNSIGISVLHIEENDWIDSKEKSIKKCFEFLKNLTSSIK